MTYDVKKQMSRHITSIKAYVAGKPLKEVEREYNISNAIKLASNENALGFSPMVNQAVNDHLNTMNRYPESTAYDLIDGLSRKLELPKSNIVVGNGSDDIIALLAHGFLNPDEQAVMPLPSFLMYEISVRTAKGLPVMVPLKAHSTNLDGLANAVTPQTKMVFVTNPFNPTGSTITELQFNRFIDRLPEDVLVIVDEAYIEFVRDDSVFNSLTSSLKDPRIVTLRTFSKAYGLAGFRVGYAVCDASVAQVLNRIRQPFNVNTLAQAAAAAALKDDAFLAQSIALTHQGIDYLYDEFEKLGISYLPTQSNFIMLDVQTDAATVFEAMLKRGVIVRSMKSYGFDTFIRVNTGTMEENRFLIKTLKQILNR